MKAPLTLVDVLRERGWQAAPNDSSQQCGLGDDLILTLCKHPIRMTLVLPHPPGQGSGVATIRFLGAGAGERGQGATKRALLELASAADVGNTTIRICAGAIEPDVLPPGYLAAFYEAFCFKLDQTPNDLHVRQPIAIGMQVQIRPNPDSLGRWKYAGRTGRIQQENYHGRSDGGLWYVRLDATTRAKERVELFWTKHLLPASCSSPE